MSVPSGISASDAAAVAGRDGLDVDVHRHERVVVVAASGAVDAFTAPVLTVAISAAMASDTVGVIIDLSQVDFLAAAGITVLLRTRDQLAPGVGFVVVANRPATLRVIALLGIDHQIDVHHRVDEALDCLNGA